MTTDLCRKCGRSKGVLYHLSVEECTAMLLGNGGKCLDPESHHEFISSGLGQSHLVVIEMTRDQAAALAAVSSGSFETAVREAREAVIAALS